MSAASITCSRFRYSDRTTPAAYLCEDCGAKGVRLYREYQSFGTVHLRCRACARVNQPQTLTPERQKRDRLHDPEGKEHEIGWLVAAVPTEGRADAYWGFTSVPQAGVEWWEALPKEAPAT